MRLSFISVAVPPFLRGTCRSPSRTLQLGAVLNPNRVSRLPLPTSACPVGLHLQCKVTTFILNMQHPNSKKVEEIFENARRTRWKAEKFFRPRCIFLRAGARVGPNPKISTQPQTGQNGRKARATLLHFPGFPWNVWNIVSAYRLFVPLLDTC